MLDQALNRAASRHEAAVDHSRWVDRCRAGDETAVTVLISQHRTRIVRTAQNLLRDRYEAEDVAQETFLKALREIHKLRDNRAFSSYLYRICVRLCMDRLRMRRAHPAEFDQPLPAEDKAIENRVMVNRLLDMLPSDLRTTLVLREMEQLSYDEIAELMSVPTGTVRSRLHAARERFRKLWLEATAE